MAKKAGPQEGEYRGKVLMQDVFHADLVMSMRLLQKAEISLEAVLALPLFHLLLHARNVAAKLEAFTISKPDIVVGFAFHEIDAFGFE